jgi:hypothetical protein
MTRGRENRLSEEAKLFVVQALACFDTPSAVAQAVRRDFDLTITPQSVEAYDPTKRAGRRLSDKWRALFEETRKAFLENMAAIGVANKAVRLRMIGRIAERAETAGNSAVALQALEQAAKEVGDAFTNKRELMGAGGAPLVPAAVQIFALPDNGRGDAG